MKKILLMLITLIITSLMILIGVGCKTTAAMEPVAVEFVGNDFEISLPENWEGGTKEELDSVIEKLKNLGQTQLADKVEANKFYLLFFGYNSEDAAEDGSVSDFTITGESAAFLSLEEYVDLTYTDVTKVYKKAGYTFNIIEQDITSLGNYEEVGRTIFEQDVEGIKTKVVQYIVKNKLDFWVLTFTTDLEEFDDSIQTFDETFKTFKILD